jgi:hypothetical protein
MRLNHRVVKQGTMVLLAGLLAAGLFHGCSRGKKLDYGKLEGSIYTNDFFNMQLTVPPQWVVNGDEVKKRMLATGQEIVKSDDARTERAIKNAADRTFQLLTLSRVAMGTAPLNSSFTCVAEEIPESTGVTQGDQYLNKMKESFKYSSLPLRVERDTYSEMIGGTQFFGLSVVAKIGTLEVPQTYHAYVTHGYALLFIGTLFNEQDRKTIDGIIGSVRFK